MGALIKAYYRSSKALASLTPFSSFTSSSIRFSWPSWGRRWAITSALRGARHGQSSSRPWSKSSRSRPRGLRPNDKARKRRKSPVSVLYSNPLLVVGQSYYYYYYYYEDICFIGIIYLPVLLIESQCRAVLFGRKHISETCTVRSYVRR